MAYDDRGKDAQPRDADGSSPANGQSSINSEHQQDSKGDSSKDSPEKAESNGQAGTESSTGKDPIVAGAVAANGLSAAEQVQNQQDTQVSGSGDPTTCTPGNPSGSPAQQEAQMGPWDGIDHAGTSVPPAQVMEQIAAAPFQAALVIAAQEALGAAYVGYEVLSKTYEYVRDAVENRSQEHTRK